METRYLYKILLGKPDCMRPVGQHNHRWEDTINMIAIEICFENDNWIEVAHVVH